MHPIGEDISLKSLKNCTDDTFYMINCKQNVCFAQSFRLFRLIILSLTSWTVSILTLGLCNASQCITPKSISTSSSCESIHSHPHWHSSSLAIWTEQLLRMNFRMLTNLVFAHVSIPCYTNDFPFPFTYSRIIWSCQFEQIVGFVRSTATAQNPSFPTFHISRWPWTWKNLRDIHLHGLNTVDCDSWIF